MHDVLGTILSRADIPGASVYAADEIRHWPPGMLDRLVELGLLREIERATSIRCDNCTGGCVITPEILEYPETGQVIGYYFCRDEEHGGPFRFDLSEFRQWRLNLGDFAFMLAKALGLESQPTTREFARLMLLGTMHTTGGLADVFLACGLHLPDAASIIERADRLQNSSNPVVLVPDRLPPRSLWQNTHPTVYSLAEHLTWPAKGSLSAQPLLNALRAVRPPISKEAWLTVTQCAQLLVKDLPFIELEQAKARVSKAAGAGKFTTNGKKRDTRRIERISFDSWRLKQRDQDLAMADVDL